MILGGPVDNERVGRNDTLDLAAFTLGEDDAADARLFAAGSQEISVGVVVREVGPVPLHVLLDKFDPGNVREVEDEEMSHEADPSSAPIARRRADVPQRLDSVSGPGQDGRVQLRVWRKPR